MIANLILDEVDRPVLERARQLGVWVTRFVDDWTVSGVDRMAVVEMLTFIENELKRLNLRFHPDKTHIRGRHEPQIVHGLCVGHGRISVPKAYRTAVEREIRRFAKYGGSREDHASLLGKIGYIGRLHSQQAERLRRKLG